MSECSIAVSALVFQTEDVGSNPTIRSTSPEFLNSNIFDTRLKNIVIPVNTVGVMGAGLALACKRKYPRVFAAYQKICKNTEFNPGDFVIVEEDQTNFVLLATKQHWRNPSTLTWIDQGLQKLKVWSLENQISELAIPAIGCGLGELNWDTVKLLILHHLHHIPTLHIYNPK